MARDASKAIVPRHRQGWLMPALLGALILAAGVAGVYMSSEGTAAMPNMPRGAERNHLSAMATTPLRVKDTVLTAWIAATPKQRQLGLMWVNDDEMSDNQGMLFAFTEDQDYGFWMKNTLIPLDIAFIRADGLVVHTTRMPPLSQRTYGPNVPYRYALELKAGTLQRAGLEPGDSIDIPPAVLKLLAKSAEEPTGTQATAD